MAETEALVSRLQGKEINMQREEWATATSESCPLLSCVVEVLSLLCCRDSDAELPETFGEVVGKDGVVAAQKHFQQIQHIRVN